MSNYLISLHHPKFGLTLFKDGFTGNHRLDDNGEPAARMREFHREYGKHGWQVDYHSNLTMFDDRRTYLVEQIAQILMGIKKLDFFPTKDMALALGIGSGWTEIFAVNLKQLQGYQGKAVQICKKLNWNYKLIQAWIQATCQKHFGTDSWAEHKYGERVFRTSPFNSRYNITRRAS
tara:strand:+ start:105 stop:632 length:528 start_codon:yes stop_codon:yes gene_type:complete